MQSHVAVSGVDRFEVRVTVGSHFGWVCTRLHLERVARWPGIRAGRRFLLTQQ
jgi:hypothetical protein